MNCTSDNSNSENGSLASDDLRSICDQPSGSYDVKAGVYVYISSHASSVPAARWQYKRKCSLDIFRFYVG